MSDSAGKKPLIVGLTGGVASGKTTVAKLIRQRGVPVLDTDEIAREVVRPGTEGWRAVRKRFGDDILKDDGELDRRRLRELVFSDKAARNDLESELHPRILAELRRQSGIVGGAYQVHVIPLLFETGLQKQVDRILVVDCPVEVQIQRLTNRDNVSEAAARSIIAAQCERETRLDAAQDVIANTSGSEDLEPLVDRLHDFYLCISETGDVGREGLRLP